MDQLPLDHNPLPGTGPRNLTVLLATWLRAMGFRVQEQGGAAPTALQGTWRAPGGLLYQVSYAFVPVQGGVFQLLAHTDEPDPAVAYRGLVHKAAVSRLREARFLLLSNVFYADDRRAALAAGAVRPAPAHPAPARPS